VVCLDDPFTDSGGTNLVFLVPIGAEILLIESEDKNLTALLALSALEK